MKSARRDMDGPGSVVDFGREGPALVHRYVERVLPPGGRVPRTVRITQAGEMVRRPGGRPLPFTAVEEFVVEEVAFSWRARFPVMPLVSMRVLDGYLAGEGRLEARLFGVPFMRVGGPETAEGEAIRYLSELPWVPHAMIANRELEWSDINARAVEVATKVGSRRVAVRLEFDETGHIVGASAERPRTEGRRTVRRPWTGTFGEYAVVGGVRIPTLGEVRWELPDGPFVYWRGTITSFELGLEDVAVP
jgi:hypothetical protein